MERDIVDIVTEKEFFELTTAELEELKEFCQSEEEYNQLKLAFTSVNAMPIEHVNPKIETKKELDALFMQTYPKAAPIWYNSVLAIILPKDKPFYRQPLVQVAAVALLIFLAVPFATNPIVNEKPIVAKNKVVQTERDGISKGDKKVENKISTTKSEVAQEELTEQPIVNNLADNIASLKDENHNQAHFLEGNSALQPRMTNTVMAADEFGSAEVMADFVHPDGVFEEDSNPVASTLSFSAAETEDLLDLLTATF